MPRSARGQQAAEEVVGAEPTVVPAGGRAPRDRGGPERVGREPGPPGEQLWLRRSRQRAASRPASRKSQERRGEGEERFHAGSVVRLCF